MLQNFNYNFMRISILFLIAIVIGITSCAQEQKKEEKSISKEQINQIVLQTVKMPVDGMVCSACQSNVKKTLKALNGVTDIEVNLENKFAIFTYDPQIVKPEQIQKAVNDKGFTAGKPQTVKQ